MGMLRGRDAAKVVNLEREVKFHSEEAAGARKREKEGFDRERELRYENSTLRAEFPAARKSRMLKRENADPLLFIDGQGKILNVSTSDRVLMMTGYSPIELVDKPLDLLMPGLFENSLKELAQAGKSITQGEMDLAGRRRLKQKDGMVVPVQVSFIGGGSPNWFCTIILRPRSDEVEGEPASL